MITEKATCKGLHPQQANLSAGFYKSLAVHRVPTWMLRVYPEEAENKGLSLEPLTTQEGVCTNGNLIRLN